MFYIFLYYQLFTFSIFMFPFITKHIVHAFQLFCIFVFVFHILNYLFFILPFFHFHLYFNFHVFQIPLILCNLQICMFYMFCFLLMMFFYVSIFIFFIFYSVSHFCLFAFSMLHRFSMFMRFPFFTFLSFFFFQRVTGFVVPTFTLGLKRQWGVIGVGAEERVEVVHQHCESSVQLCSLPRSQPGTKVWMILLKLLR